MRRLTNLTLIGLLGLGLMGCNETRRVIEKPIEETCEQELKLPGEPTKKEDKYFRRYLRLFNVEYGSNHKLCIYQGSFEKEEF